MAHKLVPARVITGKVSLGQTPVLLVHVVGPTASWEHNLGNLKSHNTYHREICYAVLAIGTSALLALGRPASIPYLLA